MPNIHWNHVWNVLKNKSFGFKQWKSFEIRLVELISYIFWVPFSRDWKSLAWRPSNNQVNSRKFTNIGNIIWKICQKSIRIRMVFLKVFNEAWSLSKPATTLAPHAPMPYDSPPAPQNKSITEMDIYFFSDKAPRSMPSVKLNSLHKRLTVLSISDLSLFMVHPRGFEPLASAFGGGWAPIYSPPFYFFSINTID